MGQECLEDRARSAAIWDAYRQPGATLRSVGHAFNISTGRVGRIVKREQAREQRAYDRRKQGLA